MLEAVSQGLGAVWLGIAPLKERINKAAKVLQLPDNLYVFAFIACGYPAEEKGVQDRYDISRIYRMD